MPHGPLIIALQFEGKENERKSFVCSFSNQSNDLLVNVRVSPDFCFLIIVTLT